MSILIRGMEMPRKCIRCPVNVYGRCLVNDDKDVSKATADAVRDKNCPLIPVPPHGRLIDADALINEDRQIYSSDGAAIGARRYITYDEVDSAPTIIETELRR